MITDGVHHTNPRSITSALNSHSPSGRILAEKISFVSHTSLSIDGHCGLFQLHKICEAVVHKQDKAFVCSLHYLFHHKVN